MKICFPVRKQNGSQYSTVDEVMGLIGREPHGSWLAGTNHLWHGGIHISQTSAPGSVLSAENTEEAVPLQCMAKGEVVAWRLNEDYKKGSYLGKELKYSTTFVLVKSVCKPDPEKEDSWLEFYSLYMGLAPVSAFPLGKCYKAKTNGINKRSASKFEASTSSDDISDVPAKCGVLKENDRVIVFKNQMFSHKGVARPFGLAKMLNDRGEGTGESFWVTLLPEYMEPDGERYEKMPAWMQKAVSQGEFDTVARPAEAFDIDAGDAIGFLGEDIAPAGRGKTSSCHYVHIEVISKDPRMPGFLNNPAGLQIGKKYLQILSGKPLYQRSGGDKDSTFKAISGTLRSEEEKILPQDKCNPFKDKSGKMWFEVVPHGWMSQDDVKEFYQYDLKELGFTTLEEEPSPDVSKSLRESWLKGAYDWLSERTGKDRGIKQKQVSSFYSNLVKKIDADGDGTLSGKELYNALHHPEMGVRDIAARLIVKHDSEWLGGSSHHRWNVYFQGYDPLRINYAKQWLDDSEWMSQVEEFKKDEPVWHMHPVVFLNALSVDSEYEITVELIEKLLGHNNPWFTGKRGGKAFATNFKNNYPDVYEFNKQSFVNLLNEQLIEYGITGAYHKAHFLSQCLHESAHLDTTLEFGSGRNYDPGQHRDAAKNGNTVVGDGPRYKGRGLIQLTWKNNYRRFSSYVGVDCVANSDLVASVMSNAIKASCWYWRYNGGIHKKYDAKGDINVLIDNEKNNVELVTLAVNGGRNGLSERQEYFNAIKEAWGLE